MCYFFLSFHFFFWSDQAENLCTVHSVICAQARSQLANWIVSLLLRSTILAWWLQPPMAEGRQNVITTNETRWDEMSWIELNWIIEEKGRKWACCYLCCFSDQTDTNERHARNCISVFLVSKLIVITSTAAAT